MLRATKIEMVARAMAKADGHDPTVRVIQSAPLVIHGRQCVYADGGIELWRLYSCDAETAIDALETARERAA